MSVIPPRVKIVLRSPPAVKSGMLASRQLKAVARDTCNARDPPNEQRPHSETPQPASTFFPSVGTANDIVPHIYRAFTFALSSSLVDSLVSGGGWLQFGNASCLRVYRDPSGWATTRRTTERLRLDVRWSPSGALTIGSRLTPLPSFSQLSDVLENGQSLLRKSLDGGVRALILPFGIPCKLLGEESQILGAIKADRPFKASTRAWLEDFGIASKRELFWVCLEIGKKRSHDSVLPNIPAVCHVWWPAHLCFIKHIGSRHRETNNLEDILTGTFTDPLDEAEQWFLGRQERESMIDARRKETEERKLANDQVLGQEDYASEEDIADAMVHANQYLSAQEASGIYPTPPDGLASNTQGSVAAQDTPGASTAGGHPHHAIASEAAHSGIVEIYSPARAMSGAPFAGDESQDLFGDMDADMFDANGLTEADFNFFDEPDEVDEMQAESAQANAQNTEDVLIDGTDVEIGGVLHDYVSAPEATPLEPQKDMQASEEHSKNHRSPKTMNTLTSDDTDLTHHESPPSSVLADDPPTVLRPSEKANDIERQAVDFSPEILHPGTLEPSKTNHDGKPNSLELIALDSRPGAFYQKYGHEGKYAAGSPEAQNGTRPSGDRQDHDQIIPSLGLLLERSQGSSEETDFSGTDHESGSVTLV